MKPPTTVNEFYKLTGNWVKPSSKEEGGTASSYVTIEEDATWGKRTPKKGRGGESKKQGDGGRKPKTPRDHSHIECLHCHEKGHYKNQCPQLKEKAMAEAEATALASWYDNKANMFVSWVNEEETVKEYTVNNVVQQHKSLLPTKVLLDNQANISVMHPMLLEDVRKSD